MVITHWLTNIQPAIKSNIIDRILFWGSPALNSGDWPGNAGESLGLEPGGGPPVSA
jgi:hypothetical protein